MLFDENDFSVQQTANVRSVRSIQLYFLLFSAASLIFLVVSSIHRATSRNEKSLIELNFEYEFYSPLLPDSLAINAERYNLQIQQRMIISIFPFFRWKEQTNGENKNRRKRKRGNRIARVQEGNDN